MPLFLFQPKHRNKQLTIVKTSYRKRYMLLKFKINTLILHIETQEQQNRTTLIQPTMTTQANTNSGNKLWIPTI
jgi:hypothetical protein